MNFENIFFVLIKNVFCRERYRNVQCPESKLYMENMDSGIFVFSEEYTHRTLFRVMENRRILKREISEFLLMND